MRPLKIVLGALSALLGVVWLVGIFLPGEYRVERSTVIDAPVPLVFEQVNSFPNWEAWSPWLAADPSIENTYTGPAAGEGHRAHWKSEQSGSGTMTITESKPGEHLAIALDFGEMGTGKSFWEFEAQDDGSTRVTWSMEGENEGAIGHYASLWMDNMVGPYYEKGLASLKAHTEELARQTPPTSADAAASTPTEATEGETAKDEGATEQDEPAH